MLIFVLEAAIRSLLMACVVWAAIRLLRVQAVVAQRVAWVLVLTAAGAMPLVMHSPWLALDHALRIPVSSLSAVPKASQLRMVSIPTSTQNDRIEVRATQARHAKTKPSAAHRITDDASLTDSIVVADNEHQTQLQVSVEPIVSPSIPYAGLHVASESHPFESHPFWTWPRVESLTLIIYLSLVAVLLLRTMIGLIIAYRIWHGAQPASELSIASAASLSIRISRHVNTPVTIGSTVILPADCRTWDETKLRIVLAHEAAHVRQGDFYLQLLASLYVAISWFSPLGWWLQRKLSELGEALSDRAGLDEAPSAASYAQVLLEFAAMPRPILPLAGVAMARPSNLSQRIDRILNDRRFRLSFLGGRRHALITAALVPAALIAVVALIRIVPAVEAQATATTAQSTSQQQSTSSATTDQTSVQTTVQASDQVNTSVTEDANVQVTADVLGQEPTSSDTVVAPIAPQAPAAPEKPVVIAPEPPEPPEPATPNLEAPEPPEPPSGSHGFAYSYSNDDRDSFAIVHGKDSTVSMSGHSGKDLAKARQKVQGDFIWFERDGKSYVITDPAILAQSEAMFKDNPELKRQQARLQAKQDELNKRMADLNSRNRPRTEAMSRLQAQLGAKQGEIGRKMAEFNRDMARMQLDSPEMKKEMAQFNEQIAKAQLDSPEMKREMAEMSAEIAKAQLDSPEMKKQMAELNAKLSELQTEKFKKLTEDLNKRLNPEVLSELQEKIGDIQGQIGEIQGTIGEQMGEFGEQQGKLGEQMGELGEEMGRIGEEQGRKAEESSRRVKSLIDKAYKEGKARPIDPQ